MTLQKDLEALGARLVPHSENWRARFWGQCAKLGGVSNFGDRFWITLAPDICYPKTVCNPWAPVYEVTVRHEAVHVVQQRQTGLYWWLTKYLASQKFRWEQEREAYLVDIRARETNAQAVAELMHDVYKVYSPTIPQMIKWFEAHP